MRPLYYTFEVASDTEFQTKMFARSQVPPGGDGRTAVQVDRLELGRTYYWRARAEDGANAGPYASAQFQLLPRAVISAPPQIAPINNEKVGTRQPTMFAGRAERNEAVGGLVYEFQIATDSAFSQMAAAALADETGGQTTYTPGHQLAANTQHFWRVRAAWFPATLLRCGISPRVGAFAVRNSLQRRGSKLRSFYPRTRAGSWLWPRKASSSVHLSSPAGLTGSRIKGRGIFAS